MYERLLLFETLYRANAALCATLGISANMALIHQILRQRRQQRNANADCGGANKQHNFGAMLMQNCVIDLVYLLNCLVLQPVFIVGEAGSIMYTIGVFAHASRPLNFAATTFSIAEVAVVLCTLPVPLLYRYLLLCWEVQRRHARRLYTALLATAIGMALAFGALTAMRGYPNEAETRAAIAAFFPDDTGGGRFNYTLSYFIRRVGVMEESPLINTLVICALVAGAYMLVGWCSWSVIRHLRVSTGMLANQKRANALNLQIAVAMLAQALLPTLVFLVPFAAAVAVTRLRSSAGFNASRYTASTLNWLPVLNPLATLAIVRDYRRTLIASVVGSRLCRCCCCCCCVGTLKRMHMAAVAPSPLPSTTHPLPHRSSSPPQQ